MNSKEILARAQELMRQAEEARRREIAEVVESIRATMREYSITLDDIQPRKTKAVVPAKYRDQAGNTWSGRGKRPRWLVDAIEHGHTLDSLRVPH
jgi:DNA-binding protein H-NS